MAKAKKLKSGSWRCLVYDYTDNNGKRHYESFTSTDPSPRGKREAELQAALYASEKKEKRQTNFLSIKDAMNSYIDKKEPLLSPATIVGYKTIENVLNSTYENFCNKNIFDITQSDIDYIITDQTKKVKPKTVRNRHGFISAVMDAYRPDFRIETDLPKKVRPDLYIPSDSDIKALMKAVEDTELEIPVMLGAFGCMRRGEICALTIRDIDGNIAHIKSTMVKDYKGEIKKKAPKTFSSDRYVDLPEFVVDKIKRQGYITKLKPDSITRGFDRTLNRIGLQHFRFHDLRHYSASVQHALGIPDAYIMERGGWKSDTVLKSVYRHAMNDRQKDMSQKANNYFEKLNKSE